MCGKRLKSLRSFHLLSLSCYIVNKFICSFYNGFILAVILLITDWHSWFMRWPKGEVDKKRVKKSGQGKLTFYHY